MDNPRRIWLIGGVMAFMALGAAAWLGLPAYRRFKERRMFTQAEAAWQKGDHRTAYISFRQVLQVNPGNLKAIRAIGDLTTEVKSPAALDWRRRAVELEASLDHKLLLASTGLQVEPPPFPIASQVLAELQAQGAGTNAGFRFVASQRALRLNRSDEAEEHLQALVAFDPTNRVHRLNLTTLRVRSNNKTVATSARQELMALVADPTFGALALRSLANDAFADAHYAEADKYCVQLLGIPRAGFEDYLMRLNVLHEGRDTWVTSWIAEVKTAAGTNALRIAAMSQWLMNHGRATNVLTWLGSFPAPLQAAPPLPSVRADAYVALRDWRGLEKFLADQRWDEQEFLRLALLTRALREQGQRELATTQWRHAMAAGQRVEGLTMLAQLARRWEWKSETDEVLWELARRAPWLHWAWQGLADSRVAAGDTRGLLRVRTAQLESVPDSRAAKNDVAICQLLLKTDLDRASRLAHEAYQAQPTNGVYASTYAFALHTQGNTAEALKVMQALPETALRWPGIAAYHGVVLAALGKRAEAEPYFVAAEKAQLLPEERQLLEQARASR